MGDDIRGPLTLHIDDGSTVQVYEDERLVMRGKMPVILRVERITVPCTHSHLVPVWTLPLLIILGTAFGIWASR